ncbi:MAG: DUF2339 domain-containing protein [Acidobacteriota bacterium]|nr:DUF2339 domain-containing protein [Acidobacteriota bacterium]
MTNADDPEHLSSMEGEKHTVPDAPLEARVARLELELAALQRQIANNQVSGGEAISRTASRPTAAPPPLPRPGAQDLPVASPSGQQTFAQQWIGSRNPPQVEAPAADSLDSFESRLGSQIFNRIAIVLLLIGTAYGLKLAVDRGLIGPTPRVLIGLVAGAGLVVWSERFRNKGFAAFSYSLKAVGSGVLYLTLWAAFQLFHLLPAAVALALMVLVTAWNAFMAWSQDAELLAVYALAGGFASPLLVSTGGNHEIFLFTYLLAIDVSAAVLVRLKTWPRLLLGIFPATVLFFIGWYSSFYDASYLAITAFFITLFGAAFAGVAIGRTEPDTASSGGRFASLATILNDILLPLANAAFVALAFYSVLQNSGHHAALPWLMLLLAAVYLGIMRLPQTRTASAMHLSLAVVFLTIAIPLKASGAWITASWLVEGLALLWVAARLASAEEEADAGAALASRVLRLLALGSLLLGFGGICFHSLDSASELTLLNKGTGTALVGLAIFAAAAWLGLSKEDASDKGGSGLQWGTITMGAFALIDLTAVLLTIRELLVSWDRQAAHPPFQTAVFVTALIGLAVFAGVVAVSLRVALLHPENTFWTSCAAGSTIAFNLVAVLTGVREIVAIWAASSMTAEQGLQQALAISAFLMLYGAALLAAGFFRRSAFLRWQALALLVFTIFKTFLYDMRNLSQGYRVGSILGLGALLMAISFAYQKDWLHLREPEAKQGSTADSGVAR